MSEQITGEQLERASYDEPKNHEGGELYKTCHICGDQYITDAGVKIYESDSGRVVCEYCEHTVVKYRVQKTHYDKWYGSYELGSEEFSTAWMPTRKEAKDRLIAVLDKLHPEIERVED